MKLVTFNDGQVGRISDDQVIELDVASTREFFERDQQAGETGRRYPLARVRLRAPIAPKKFFHTAGNFREHHEDLARVNWSHPVNKGIVFFQNVDAIIGPDDPIVYPEQLTSELDYELEMAIVIGKPGRFFSAEQAVEHIGGYLIFNDITARDIQRREMKSGVFSFSKAIDTFCPIGPYILTADEAGDPHDLDMELRVNGQVRQKSNTRKMSVSIPQLVAYHSPQVYSAGDLITTGTVVTPTARRLPLLTAGRATARCKPGPRPLLLWQPSFRGMDHALGAIRRFVASAPARPPEGRHMEADADHFLELLHQFEDFTEAMSPERAHAEFDETTLQLFWMRWPRLSSWAGSLWRMLSEEMSGPSAPHTDSELDEVGEGG